MGWQQQIGNQEGEITWSFKLRSGKKLYKELEDLEKPNSTHPSIKSKSLKRCYMGG